MRWLFTPFLLLMFGSTAFSQEPADEIVLCDALQITGTFSDLHFDESAERLIGAEVRIVPTQNAYQASLQFSDDTLSDLSIGDVEFNVDLRHWPLGVPLPEREPDTDSVQIRISDGPYAGTFDGKITRTHLAGVLLLVSGKRITLNLPRRTGYWE